MIAFANGFVVNPNELWRPVYRISPFNTSHVAKNAELVKKGKIDQQLIQSFFGEEYDVFGSGREAIDHALSLFDLKKEDEVWILTSSANKYISSCVTTKIDKYCKWSREKSERTKIIFVNHEFGKCYPDLPGLKKHGLPIIEDRAMSFNSMDEDLNTGKTGDLVVYSLPKYFPVSFGGVLQYNNNDYFKRNKKAEDLEHYFSVLMSHYLTTIEKAKEGRQRNYSYLKQAFGDFGYAERFIFTESESPGVFMFRANDVDLVKLKVFMQANGVESSVFYGENAFFLPVHENLNTADLDFFYQLIAYFKQHGNK